MAKNKQNKQAPKSWKQQLIEGEKYSVKQVSLFFLIIGTLLYFNTIGNQYSMDDSLVSQGQPAVMKGIKGIPEILTSSYIQDEGKIKGEFRPTTQITFALEYEMFGENPHISHFLNAFYYGIICLLLYQLFSQLFDKKHQIYILLGVLIFTVHPIHSEVVASLKNRENILGMLFGLLTAIQALKYFDSSKIKHVVFGMLFFAIALLAKVDSIVFVGIIILMAIFRKMPTKKVIGSIIIAGIVFISFTMYRRFFINPDGFRYTEYFETPLVGDDKNILNTILLALSSLWYYLKLNIFPYPLRFYYGTGLINIPKITDITVWISFAFHSILLFYGIRGTMKRKFYGFAIMWYLASIFVFIHIIEPVTGIIAERHTFIANAGFSMLLAYCFIEVLKWLKAKDVTYAKILTTCGIIYLFLGVMLIFNRNKDWYDAKTLYSADAPKLEPSIFFHFEYGNQFARETGIDPSDTVKYKGNLLKSVEEYKKVLSYIPDHRTTWYNMGVSYIRMGDMKNGRECFLKTRELDSTWRAVDHLIGLTTLILGDTNTAIPYFEKELERKPNNGGSLNSLYEIYKARNEYNNIIALGLKLEKKGIKTERLYKTIANSYYFIGDMDKAMYYRQKVENGEFSGEENNGW